jgi:hypothetical protein
MSEEQSRHLDQGDPEDDFQPPDLRPLRALAEREELADARARLADGLGHPLPSGDPNAPLARGMAAALTEAGFTLHNCAPDHPQYRLGGVCVLPIPGRHNPDGQGGIAVSWTTHNLLTLDWDRGREHHDTQQTMNRALASVLKALGYQVGPFGTGGASLVTEPRRGGPMTTPPDPALTGTSVSTADRAIRASATVAVLGVAGIAAYISYWHAYEVISAHGESGVTARLEPATIDGLVYCSSMVVLYAARHQLHVPALARWLLGLGIAATLAANLAHGWSHGPIGATVAAWPAASLVGSYELLLWLIRTASAGATTREPGLYHVDKPADQLVPGLRLVTGIDGPSWTGGLPPV